MKVVSVINFEDTININQEKGFLIWKNNKQKRHGITQRKRRASCRKKITKGATNKEKENHKL
jgi:hypothetical protein